MAGAGSKDFTPDALAWYAFPLDIPVILMAVPAFVHRNIPFMIAFIGLIVLVFFLGLGYHDVNSAIHRSGRQAPAGVRELDLAAEGFRDRWLRSVRSAVLGVRGRCLRRDRGAAPPDWDRVGLPPRSCPVWPVVRVNYKPPGGICDV